MKEITVKEVLVKMANGEPLHLIDVREVAEVQEGHIAGIINIPLGLLEFRLHELDKNKPYIMVCRSGGRSGQATAFLQDRGFDVTNMVGGMIAWDREDELN
ncbi:rhodanese-like domain-containing protein [Sporosarcina sp. YIM B06819]|uniref:rhodanese-like domain-containing protein n=1 Tax=Sporosarcina sp. YIM B06819 TaxID=3081769 RepID=UPI00298C553D|nr:rhodanese-like domain-containing protein [Sporosarcina sp. YIM B06819]